MARIIPFRLLLTTNYDNIPLISGQLFLLSIVMLLERLFITIFPIAFIVLIGFLYTKKFKPDLAFSNIINMDLFIPALIFSVLSAKSLDLINYQGLALGAAMVIIGSGIILLPLHWCGINLKTFLPPMMFNNSGNMGIPLIVLAFGQDALPGAVIIFIIGMTLHFTIGIYMLDHKTKLHKLLSMPIILATIAGLIVSVSDFTVPSGIAISIEMIGQIAIPLMLFTLGARLTDVDFSDWKIGLLGAVLCPLSGLLMAVLAQQLLALPPQQYAILLVFGAMPPAVLNYILADKYQQQPAKVAAIVLIGNIFSLVSLSLTLAWVL